MNGCLIDSDSLEPGDKVFHFLKGWMTVSSIDKNTYINSIVCDYMLQKGSFMFNLDGKVNVDDLYPAIYRINPFEFVIGVLRDKRNLAILDIDAVEDEIVNDFIVRLEHNPIVASKNLKTNVFYLRNNFFNGKNMKSSVIYAKEVSDKAITGGYYVKALKNNYQLEAISSHEKSDVTILSNDEVRIYIEQCLKDLGIVPGTTVKELRPGNYGSIRGNPMVVLTEKLEIVFNENFVRAIIGNLVVFDTDWGFVTPV